MLISADTAFPFCASLKAALSPLQFHPAHEIAFSKRRALVAENVVSRDRMEKEVRQRERHQEAFRREWKRALARLERDIAADERVDSLRGQGREFIPRLRYQCLECGIVQVWFARLGNEHSVLCRL